MSVYLDNNATTPVDERVLDAMLPYMREQFGNPSSNYQLGRQARAAINLAREQVANLVNAHPTQVVFTGGGTEANNLAIKGITGCMSPGLVAVSEVEHHSVSEAAHSLKDAGWDVLKIAVDESGNIRDSSVSAVTGKSPKLMSVMLANNETGVINNITAVAEYAHQCNALLHTDAVQAIGKIPVDFRASGTHMMSISAHKLYGPKGVGALIVDKAVSFKPLLNGGGQEKSYRAGTENVAAIVGFGKAAELAESELSQRQKHLLGLRDCMEARLATELSQLTIFGKDAERLPNTTFFAVPGVDGETLLIALDQDGIAVSSGSACGSGEVEPSHVLLSMGVEKNLARGAVRVSMGKDSKVDDIDRFIESLKVKIKVFQNYGAVA